MFTARTLARSAPRAISRIARPTTIARSSAALCALPARSTQVSCFSTSLLRKASSGKVDSELSTKLASEMEFEIDMKENEVIPVSVKDFQENGPFEIQDIPGSQNVVLTRNYGKEKITVTFSIADINSMEDDMVDDEHSMDDEGDIENLENNLAHEEGEGADGAEESESGAEHSSSCRLSIVIEKPGQKGALNVEAVAQDGSIIVENMYYYDSVAVAHAATAEATHQGTKSYAGPPFGTLDEDLQLLMEQYLDERGINSALAVFAPDYLDAKEQREYLAWLKNIKSFIDQ